MLIMKAEEFQYKQKNQKMSGEKQYIQRKRLRSLATEDAIVSPTVISTVNVCGRCNKESTAMQDSWRRF